MVEKEPLRAVAACHQRIDQMWDVHNAVNDKLEPIIIFVSPPQGPWWAGPTRELRWAKGGSGCMEMCTCWLIKGAESVRIKRPWEKRAFSDQPPGALVNIKTS